MHVVTLNKSEFEKSCSSLAVKIAENNNLIALIGVRTGGATVAKLVFNQLGKQNESLRYYEVGASRYATVAKNSYGIKKLFMYVPGFFLDWLRIIEYYIVSIRMRFFYKVDRSIQLDNGLEDYLADLDDGRLFVIDDAIDSGATVKNLLDKLHLINPLLEYKVAVLVVTQNMPLITPDVSLYKNVLLRFPWSSDYK